MSTIALISCTKTKAQFPTRTDELYTSALFKKSLLYALTHADQHFILSAKYGLLAPDTRIEPYERTLKAMDKEQKNQWTAFVAEGLSKVVRPRDTFLILTGREYYRTLLPHIHKLRCSVRIPFEGESLGTRLASLSAANDEERLGRMSSQFYTAMNKLYIAQDGGRRLGDATGKMTWPKRGVYFFMEDEERLDTARYSPLKNRITRVGTHAVSLGSKTSLWDRLSTHKGVISGSGSHRSSIFRLHVGAALQLGGYHCPVGSWGAGQVAPRAIREEEEGLERAVSHKIGNMKVLWLDVGDDAGPTSDRSFIERNAIGLLSRSHVLRPTKSGNWLGSHSSNYRIALSGLWNLNYLFEEPHPQTIDVISEYVERTIKGLNQDNGSIAPKEWYKPKVNRSDSQQLKLGLE